jgi:uncharacterized protein (DUF736 family)
MVANIQTVGSGFVYSAVTYSALPIGNVNAGLIDTVGWGINNSGSVVGTYLGGSGYIYGGGSFTRLQDRHPEPPDQGRPHRPRDRPDQRQRTQPPRLCRSCRDRAAWPKRSNEGRDYLSVKLDDPSFNAPIYANLLDDEGAETCTLIWSRSRKPHGD